jgi:hypothetical protein
MAGDRFSGPAIGSIAAGGLLAYAGIKGYSIPATVRKLISGQSPAGQAQVTGLTSTSGTTAATTASATASTTGTGAGSSASETSFQQAMLSDLGAPVTAANLSSLHDWFLHEEPSFPPPNAWNPLNIESGAGFAQYASLAAGAQATAQFIEDNGYNEIRMMLLSGNGLCGDSCASDFLRWSDDGYSSVC